MKTNKKTNKNNHLKDPLWGLAQTVGDFIRYWGFRRIHGQIWTLTFLLDRPLTPTELASRLRVSKSLVSSALGDLEEYALILRLDSGVEGRSKAFEANPEVIKVIQTVLRERELQMVKTTLEQAEALEKNTTLLSEINSDRLKALMGWSSSAKSFLEMISAESPDNLEGLGWS